MPMLYGAARVVVSARKSLPVLFHCQSRSLKMMSDSWIRPVPACTQTYVSASVPLGAAPMKPLALVESNASRLTLSLPARFVPALAERRNRSGVGRTLDQDANERSTASNPPEARLSRQPAASML